MSVLRQKVWRERGWFIESLVTTLHASFIHIWYRNHFEDLFHHNQWLMINHPLLQLIARVLLIVQWPDSFLCRTHFRASTASLPPCPQALGAKSFAAMMMTTMMMVMVMMTLVVMELMRRVHITIIVMNGDFGRSLLVFMSDIPCLQPRVATGNFNIDLRLWLKREKFNPCDL